MEDSVEKVRVCKKVVPGVGGRIQNLLRKEKCNSYLDFLVPTLRTIFVHHEFGKDATGAKKQQQQRNYYQRCRHKI